MAIEVVQVLRREVQPARFPRTHGQLQIHFGAEGPIAVPQVQDVGRVRHRQFNHVDRTWHPRGFIRAREADVFRP